LVDDRAQVQLLGGDQRKALAQVEAHLPAEHAAGAGAGAVGLVRPVFEHVAQQVEVLLHATPPAAVGCRVGDRRERARSRARSASSGGDSSGPMVSQPNAMAPMSAAGTRTNSTAKRNTP